ncbi:PLP-dependent aminotransferase family protein [Ruania alba]|uniref:DNA-binding transcriptional regulator, MocR family, contains an aminotransferase domain n=1 Tax=Ruania alba TaxID=648782 RepID=A0A1H5EE39_9MICO|nr:PLP-dependent aminotransferase family protein [Ruania alba]SED89234.1 DNA-binding transcriptional regulator, MocR family, contains an aminotransferase domain [Ruania alba]
MATEPAPISFARGAPSLDIIDVEGLRAAADRAFTNDPAGSFAYGTSVGYKPLRAWIADRHGVSEDQVLVTNGSMQADAFLFETLVSAGDTVVVERPSYDRTLLSLKGRAADLKAIPLQEDGVDVAAFTELVRANPVALAHLIPNFQNPAGYSLSGDKRRTLVELAREQNFTIFEDDPYVELRFSGEPQPTMLSLATGGEVVYASSFSKTVCPGIRVGYLVGDAELIAKIAKLATGTYISPNMVAQSIVNEFVRGGSFESSIETVKTALAERAQRLCAGLREHVPDAQFVEPEGGYFLWVNLPEGVDGDALFDAAAARGVQIVKGSDFLLDDSKNAIRLAYSGVTPDEIDEGARRLGEAYRSL